MDGGAFTVKVASLLVASLVEAVGDYETRNPCNRCRRKPRSATCSWIEAAPRNILPVCAGAWLIGVAALPLGHDVEGRHQPQIRLT